MFCDREKSNIGLDTFTKDLNSRETATALVVALMYAIPSCLKRIKIHLCTKHAIFACTYIIQLMKWFRHELAESGRWQTAVANDIN